MTLEDGLAVIDATTDSLLTTISLPRLPFDVAVSPDGRRAYVTNPPLNAVHVIDTATNSIVGLISLAASPTGVTTTASEILVATTELSVDTSWLVRIDAATNTAIGNPIRVGRFAAEALDVAPEHRLAAVALTSDGLLALVDLDMGEVATVPIGGASFGVALTRGGIAYVTLHGRDSVAVVDAAAGRFTGVEIPVGDGPWEIVVSPDEARLYVANVADNTMAIIDSTTNRLVTSVQLANYPSAMAFSPDGMKLYAAHDTGATRVSVLETLGNRVISTIPVRSRPRYGVATTLIPLSP